MKFVTPDPAKAQAGKGYEKNRLLSAEELRQPGTLLQVVTIQPGDHVPPHSHRTSIEVYIIRRGVCDLIVDGEKHVMRPGDVILMEPGDVHELHNHGDEPFELWVFKTNAAEGDSTWH